MVACGINERAPKERVELTIHVPNYITAACSKGSVPPTELHSLAYFSANSANPESRPLGKSGGSPPAVTAGAASAHRKTIPARYWLQQSSDPYRKTTDIHPS